MAEFNKTLSVSPIQHDILDGVREGLIMPSDDKKFLLDGEGRRRAVLTDIGQLTGCHYYATEDHPKFHEFCHIQTEEAGSLNGSIDYDNKNGVTGKIDYNQDNTTIGGHASVDHDGNVSVGANVSIKW